MAEEVKVFNTNNQDSQINQNNQNQQKDFTSKKKQEKADLKFNTSSIAKAEVKVEANTEIKQESIKEDVKKEVKEENKQPESSEKVEKNTFDKRVAGKVVSASKLSYIVKTKEGNGVLVTGKHNKKIGDVI